MNIIFGILAAFACIFLVYKLWSFIKRRVKEKQQAHRLSIQPILKFYANQSTMMMPGESGAYLANIGNGTAMDITIKDFHHPKEKDWHFIFQKFDSLEPGQDLPVNFDFLVADKKASNKNDMLWMFDPEHDHDFMAQVMISFVDVEGNRYRQTNQMGKGEYSPGKPVQLEETKNP